MITDTRQIEVLRRMALTPHSPAALLIRDNTIRGLRAALKTIIHQITHHDQVSAEDTATALQDATRVLFETAGYD